MKPEYENLLSETLASSSSSSSCHEGVESSDDVVVEDVKEALTGQNWRGPVERRGRPRKGCETKSKYRKAVEENDLVREIDEQQKSNVLEFHGASDPSVPILKERPEHRVIAYMRAQGLTRREIFIRLGGRYDRGGKPVSGTSKFSYVHLGNILQQPWSRRIVAELQHEAGMDQVSAAIEAELPGAVETVTEIMYDKEASANARLAAARELLDRGLGKPTQHVSREDAAPLESLEKEAEAIDAESEEISKELKRLGVNE